MRRILYRSLFIIGLLVFMTAGRGLPISSGYSYPLNRKTDAAPIPHNPVPPDSPGSAAQRGTNLSRLFIPNRGQSDARVRYYVKSSSQTIYMTEDGLVFDMEISSNSPKPRELRASAANENEIRRGHVLRLDFQGEFNRTALQGRTPTPARIHYLIGGDPTNWVTDLPTYEELLYPDMYPGIDMRLYHADGRFRYDFIVKPGGDPNDILLAVRGADALSIRDEELIADTTSGEIRQTRPFIYQEREKAKIPIKGGFKLSSDNTSYGFDIGGYDSTRSLIIDPALITLPYSTFLGGSGDDEGRGIAEENGYVYVTGMTKSSNFPTSAGAYDTSLSGINDAFIAKFDTNSTGASSLMYCTFLGGSGEDVANGIDLLNDEACVVGTTDSPDFPSVGDPDNYSFHGASGNDAFITRLNAGGSAIVCSMCIGDNGSDSGYGIYVRQNNSIWISGITENGSTFYDHSPYKKIHGTLTPITGQNDAFVVQCDTTTPGLGTIAILGGTSHDEVAGISGDSQNIYVAGTTFSDNFPVSPNVFQQSLRGQTDGWVAKLNYAGDLIYSTYLGSSGTDVITGIDVGNGDAFVCGYTEGLFPTTEGGYDTDRTHWTTSGNDSGFITRLAGDGRSLHYSSFIETSDVNNNSRAMDIHANPSGTDCRVTGSVTGSLLTADLKTQKNYYSDYRGGSDAFAARFETAASGDDSLMYITHLGSNNDQSEAETGKGIAGDYETTYVTGYTNGAGFPTADAYQTVKSGGRDAFVSKLTEPLPASTTLAASDIDITSARLNGRLDSKSGAPSLNAYFEWKKSGAASYNTANVGAQSTAPAEFSADLSSLDPATTYFYRTRIYCPAYGGDFYGAEGSFTTASPTAPAVSTAAVTGITAVTAAGGGTVTSDGGAEVTARGVCWSTAGNPTTADSRTTNGTGTGTFSSSITGLAPTTQYYVRAYATNGIGTSYGTQVTFTTTAAPPTVTTSNFTTITSTSAGGGGGNVTADGGAEVTARGVCWNTTGTPTRTDSHTTDGTGTGSFSSSITGLRGGTTYFVRAYALNSAGTAYGNQVQFTTPLSAPIVISAAVGGITSTSAIAGGTVTSDGGAEVTARGTCWSTSPNPTTADSRTSDGSSTGSFISNLSGLSPGTTYYTRVYAVNSVGTSYGNGFTFTTLGPPTVTTTAISSITHESATSGGNVTADGGAAVTARGVCWNTTGNPTLSDSHTADGTGTGGFSSSLTGLSQGTSYHVRAYAVNSIGTTYGNQLSFTTIEPPTISTTAANTITHDSASSGGDITFDGGAAVTARGVCWNTGGSPTTADSKTSDGTGTGVFTSNMTGLSPATTYYLRAYAVNSAGTAYGGEVNFTTEATIAAITTTAASSVTHESASSGGNVTSDGGLEVTARGVCWSTVVNPTTANSQTSDGTGTGVFTSSITGLSPGTTYYIRAFATNSEGTAYGNQVSFETESTIPTVTTQAPSAVTSASASTGGNVTADGGETVTARGVCWSTTPNPTTDDSHTLNGTGTGVFNSNLTGLLPATTYYVRAFARNSVNVAYGNELSFTTETAPPTVTTSGVIAVTSVSASSGGNVTADGGAAVTARGICWSPTPNPTTADSHTSDGSGTGVFTSHLSGLLPATTYYVRAYAANSAGTSYGAARSFRTVHVHTICFSCDDGGMLSGDLEQLIERGGTTTAVTAVPDTGAFFVNWTGNEGFVTTTDNPLVLSNVQADMNISAHFSSAGPKISIITPAAGSTVWGEVQIQAEVTDDSSVEDVKFLIDGVEPNSGVILERERVSTMKEPTSMIIGDGALWLDLSGGSLLFISANNRLRKVDSAGRVSAVIASDPEVLELALDHQNRIHLLFVEPQRLGNGKEIRWVAVDIEELKLSGIDAEPLFLNGLLAKSPALQFDAAGGLYYFSRQDAEYPALIRKTETTTEVIYQGTGDPIDKWLVLPDGQVLLETRRPEAKFPSLLKIAPDSTDTLLDSQSDFSSALFAAARPEVAEQPWPTSEPFDRIKCRGNRILILRSLEAGPRACIGGLDNGAWSEFDLPTFRSLEDIELNPGGLVIAGRETAGSLSSLWAGSVDPSGKIAFTLLTRIEEGVRRCVSLPSPEAGSDQPAVNGIPISKPLRREVPINTDGPLYTIAWNTLTAANGTHVIKVVAVDDAGIEVEDHISVTVGNLEIALTVESKEERAWIIRRAYNRLSLSVTNSGGVPVAQYTVTRQSGNGSPETIHVITSSEMPNGQFSFDDMTVDRNATYTYNVIAATADGNTVGRSPAVTR